MTYVALGVLVLALLASLGRRPLVSRAHWRLLTYALAAATAGGGIFVAARGAWIDGLILLAAAIWLAASARVVRIIPAADMGLAEARTMLGVSEAANRDEIETAYRRLMLRVHPDRGGAAGLAAQLNAARDRLLRPEG